MTEEDTLAGIRFLLKLGVLISAVGLGSSLVEWLLLPIDKDSEDGD